MKTPRSQEAFHLFLLVLAAIIWGLTFVAQKKGMDTMGPFGFNAVRFYIGATSLLPLIFFQQKLLSPPTQPHTFGQTLRGGVILGAILFTASGLQQVGMVETGAGNAGFITSLYIILVPLIGLFIGHRVSVPTWMGALCAIGGLYLLSGNGSVRLAPGDGLVLFSALFWALHIIATSHYAHRLPIVTLAIVQFTTTATLHLCTALITAEGITVSSIGATLGPLLFAGVLSSGIAFTLQIVGQRHVAPPKAAIVMSLEALFGLLGGILYLGEVVSPLQGIGAVIMLSGLMLSQLDGLKGSASIREPVL